MASTTRFEPQPDHFPDPSALTPTPVTAARLANEAQAQVSGRYFGPTTTPPPDSSSLELRVDINPRSPTSPTMRRVSGDFYREFSITIPGMMPREWRVYRESWIIESPTVPWSANLVEITGSVKFWQGSHPKTTARLRIPWQDHMPPGPAEVVFTETGGTVRGYSCEGRSEAFREMELEVDVCASVNKPPVLPTYDTHSHSVRPAGLPRRTLTLEQCYADAGVAVVVSPELTVINDGDPTFETWSSGELHEAMERAFSLSKSEWPRWNMWGLLAGAYEDSLVGGIMFDTALEVDGAGPERQGFAVFRNHFWFDKLPAGVPADEEEADAMRQFLYTWVHEAGHAFNFLHSWDKGRPNSLSWMNYPERVLKFWDNFRLTFDDEELIHLRHGDRAAVIMGGDPWSSGGHLEAPTGMMAAAEGNPPIELLLRSKTVFEFMEPVSIELRLRNVTDAPGPENRGSYPGLPVAVDARLHPDFGAVTIYIKQPGGKIAQYAPLMCKMARPKLQTLLPASMTKEPGADRFSEYVPLAFGKHGFYFDEPGEYLIRAVYEGTGDVVIPSNTLRLRVALPESRDEERLAQDYFSREVGLNIYLGGSRAERLARGTELLYKVARDYGERMLGAKAASILAQSLARPFFEIAGSGRAPKLQRTHEPDPEAALNVTDPALKVYRTQPDKQALNLPYARLRRRRAKYLVQIGKPDQAKRELKELTADLENRGVNRPVLEAVRRAAAGIGSAEGPEEGPRRGRRRTAA